MNTNSNRLTVVGIMSGTSLDGVDFVLTEVQRNPEQKITIECKKHFYLPFPAKLKKQLQAAVEQKLKMIDFIFLHSQLGQFYCQGLLKANFPKFDLIGLHGQTVFHHPPEVTAQIGEPAYLAKQFSCPVVHDFRTNDLIVGGQGAPLAPLFHGVAFASGGSPRVVLNLGGIANLTEITGSGEVLQAFDTGPANMVLDGLLAKILNLKMDVGGKRASRGNVLEKSLEQFLKHPYFAKKPPKSCGREQFGEKFLQEFLRKTARANDNDRLATAAELTAMTVATAIKNNCKIMKEANKPELIVCGGGSFNTHLLQRIAVCLAQATKKTWQVKTSSALGWEPQTVEGGAFALLAALRMWHLPGNAPQATGAHRPVFLGKVTEVPFA